MFAMKVLQSENVGHSINWHEGLRAANPTYKSTHSPSVWLTRFAPLLSSYRPRRYCGTWRSEIHLGHVTMFHPQTMVPFGQQPGISRLRTAPLHTLVLMKYLGPYLLDFLLIGWATHFLQLILSYDWRRNEMLFGTLFCIKEKLEIS
mgnify:CR=1 FL=1